jgi:hypothetical protein
MSGSLNAQHSLKRFRRARSQHAFKRPRTRTKFPFRLNPAGYATARREINSVMNNPNTNFPLRTIMTRQKVLPFEYGSQAQRVRLGEGITDMLAGR